MRFSSVQVIKGCRYDKDTKKLKTRRKICNEILFVLDTFVEMTGSSHSASVYTYEDEEIFQRTIVSKKGEKETQIQYQNALSKVNVQLRAHTHQKFTEHKSAAYGKMKTFPIPTKWSNMRYPLKRIYKRVFQNDTKAMD